MGGIFGILGLYRRTRRLRKFESISSKSTLRVCIKIWPPYIPNKKQNDCGPSRMY
ncbi:hypothetical protein WN55_02862 [Dufourea novaeangliae]|uniref:Uncharacterized protein n=1 Tax=Dufourea novaeangliae TaxID=178035 RepID=A0A154PK33_DUFNO|nr:hypothetical protein WN55_02862 [Dufourea novaeangliae]